MVLNGFLNGRFFVLLIVTSLTSTQTHTCTSLEPLQRISCQASFEAFETVLTLLSTDVRLKVLANLSELCCVPVWIAKHSPIMILAMSAGVGGA